MFCSLVNIIKVNELRKGIGRDSGKPFEMQDAECVLLDDAGQVQQVGVLLLPKELTGDKAPKPGVYSATFSLQANMKDRRIGAVVTSLAPAQDRLRAPAAAKAAA